MEDVIIGLGMKTGESAVIVDMVVIEDVGDGIRSCVSVGDCPDVVLLLLSVKEGESAVNVDDAAVSVDVTLEQQVVGVGGGGTRSRDAVVQREHRPSLYLQENGCICLSFCSSLAEDAVDLPPLLADKSTALPSLSVMTKGFLGRGPDRAVATAPMSTTRRSRRAGRAGIGIAATAGALARNAD